MAPLLNRKLTQIKRRLVTTAIGALLIGVESVTGSAANAAATPVYQTNTVPNSGITAESQGVFPTNEPTSVGFFFDTQTAGQKINALGLYALEGWASAPSPSAYTVTLWAYTGFENPSTDFVELASVVFKPEDAGTYIQSKQYYWIQIPEIDLGPATAGQPRGFAIAAIGDFGPSSIDPSIPASLPTLYGGTDGTDFSVGSFTSGYAFDGNGFNTPESVEFASFPIPLDYYSNPPEANNPLSFYGFFNPNAAFYTPDPPLSEVPGPLPLMGTAAAFVMSRRLRRRIGDRQSR